MKSFDYLVIGGGIVGLSVARELVTRLPMARVCILEKEREVAQHASGRNSGVLHAGFYYSADSLKARFTQQGNQQLQKYCDEHKLRINRCGKLVVAFDETEVAALSELKLRGDRNGVELQWLDQAEVARIDPNARTYERALFSPTTATIDPLEICFKIREELAQGNVSLQTGVSYQGNGHHAVKTNRGIFEAGFVINCAGLYADKIARDFGFCRDFVILPFKGLYLKYTGQNPPVRTHVYPVPDLANPFLGVHFTLTVDHAVEVGPTAVPAFWRENYSGLSRFRLKEFLQIARLEASLLCWNSFGFRKLAVEEIKKYRKTYFLRLAAKMVKQMDFKGFHRWGRPGIRAQLLDLKTKKLVQDFVVEGDSSSIHVLNAVSPAFTCSFPIAEHLVAKILDNKNQGE